MFFDQGELEKILPGFHSADMRAIRRQRVLRTKHLQCPNCRSRMIELKYGPVHTRFIADRCPHCGGFWLDGGEFENLFKASRTVDKINRMDLLTVDKGLLEDALTEGEWSPEAVVSLLTGLPVETERRCGIVPWGTFGLIALNVLVFVAVLAAGNPERTFREWGLVPARILRGESLVTLVTCMFLHSGFMHLLGNMYFLYLFGDNVEEKTGPARFPAYFLLLGIIASLTSAAAGFHDPQIPHVGASGAVSGIMGTYLILYPRTKLVTVWFYQPVRISAWLYIVFWAFFQLLLLWTGTRVDVPAHLAGLAAGLGAGIFMRRK